MKKVRQSANTKGNYLKNTDMEFLVLFFLKLSMAVVKLNPKLKSNSTKHKKRY